MNITSSPQRDVNQVQVYLIVNELSQKFNYNDNLSSYPPIPPPREYLSAINLPKPLNQSFWSFYTRLDNNLLYVHTLAFL